MIFTIRLIVYYYRYYLDFFVSFISKSQENVRSLNYTTTQINIALLKMSKKERKLNSNTEKYLNNFHWTSGKNANVNKN